MRPAALLSSRLSYTIENHIVGLSQLHHLGTLLEILGDESPSLGVCVSSLGIAILVGHRVESIHILYLAAVLSLDCCEVLAVCLGHCKAAIGLYLLNPAHGLAEIHAGQSHLYRATRLVSSVVIVA